ncbi:MAG: ankyrin repeat domain-containing protein [Elusimicrobiota bacterium]|nr:MAG: ankyrin repeat domain-containing protein [Elusimicrobiota bacterium]
MAAVLHDEVRPARDPRFSIRALGPEVRAQAQEEAVHAEMNRITIISYVLAAIATLSGCAGGGAHVNSPFEAAVVAGDDAAASRELEKLPPLDSSNAYWPLVRAAGYGKVDLLKRLLDRGAPVTVNNKGWTLLHAAAAGGRLETSRLLVERGCAVDAPDEEGYTPLMMAAGSGNLDLVKFLLSKGADFRVALSRPTNPERGLTAVGQAARSNRPEVVSYLVSLGAETEESIAALDRDAEFTRKNGYTDHTGMLLNGKAAELLRRYTVKTTATAAPVSGVTKADLEALMKAAAAKPAEAPAAAEIKSDVDAPSYKAAQNPDAFAVVVGAEKYDGLPDAKFAERDAKAMAAHLVAMGYPQRNVMVLTGSRATKTGLLKNLEAWLPNNVTEKSTVFFYFSGHGAPDAKSAQAYLVPVDGDPQYLEETAYPIKRLYEKLGSLKAKRVIVALDSCFSGAGGRSVLAPGTRPLVGKFDVEPKAAKITALTASASSEISGSSDAQGHGLFTYELLKALGETAGRGTVGSSTQRSRRACRTRRGARTGRRRRS